MEKEDTEELRQKYKVISSTYDSLYEDSLGILYNTVVSFYLKHIYMDLFD